MAGDGDRIAHVVQAVEARDQVVARAGESVGAGDLTTHAVGQSRLLGSPARAADRWR